ncbi:major capsid protein [Fusobacterium necrophorum subsp. funduliforme]
MLTERQKEYIGVYAAIPSPNMFYWDLFREAREAYLGLGDTINLNEVMAEMKEAGIVPRDTELPPMTINGNVAVSITPDIVGNSVGISALDSINANRTDTVVVNGEQMTASQYDVENKTMTLKNSICNTTNRMAAQALLTGKVKCAGNQEVDMKLPKDVQVDNKPKSWVTFFVEKINDYQIETGYMPSYILVGSKIAAELITEIQNTKASLLAAKVEKKGQSAIININGVLSEIRTLPPAIGYTNLIKETEDKVFLINNMSLVPLYAGLEFVGDTNNPEMMRGDVFVDKGDVNKQTGRATLFAKSAPFPAIALPKLIKVYKVTLG